METLYETSHMGSTVRVFSTHLEWSFLSRKTTVPLNQIASIDLTPLLDQVVIETTGGKKLKIPVGSGEKGPVMEAIYKAQASSA